MVFYPNISQCSENMSLESNGCVYVSTYMYTYYILQPFVDCQPREAAWDRNGFFCHSNLVNRPKTQLHQECFLLQPPLVESECRGTKFVWGREPSRPLKKNSWSISNPPSWKMMSSLQAITMCWQAQSHKIPFLRCNLTMNATLGVVLESQSR